MPYEVHGDGKIYQGEELVVDLRRLHGWQTFSKREVCVWAGVARDLSIVNPAQLVEHTTARWWLALCQQNFGRRYVRLHIEQLAASGLRFSDWVPAENRTFLDRNMTASRRWNRALPVLQRSGIYYVEQLALFSDELLLDRVTMMNERLLSATRHAVEVAKS